MQHHGELIPITEELPFDPDAQRVFAGQQERVRQIATRVCGCGPYPIDWSPDRECAAGNLVADMLRERAQADVAVALGGHWRSGLDAGDITVGGSTQRAVHGQPRSDVIDRRSKSCSFLREGLKPRATCARPRPARHTDRLAACIRHERVRENRRTRRDSGSAVNRCNPIAPTASPEPIWNSPRLHRLFSGAR